MTCGLTRAFSRIIQLLKWQFGPDNAVLFTAGRLNASCLIRGSSSLQSGESVARPSRCLTGEWCEAELLSEAGRGGKETNPRARLSTRCVRSTASRPHAAAPDNARHA